MEGGQALIGNRLGLIKNMKEYMNEQHEMIESIPTKLRGGVDGADVMAFDSRDPGDPDDLDLMTPEERDAAKQLLQEL